MNHQTINTHSASLHGLQTIKPRARVHKPHARHSIEPWGPHWTVYGAGIQTHGGTLDDALKLWCAHFHQRQTTGTLPWGNCA